MTNESDLTRKVDNAVIEVSFGQNRPVTVRVIELQKGSRVDARINDIVDIIGGRELVLGLTSSSLRVLGYNGKCIYVGNRVLNNYVIYDLQHFAGYQTFSPGDREHRNFKRILEQVGIAV